MDKDGVDTKLDARYVDDGRTLMHPIKAGWRWSEGESRMVWSKEQEADDTMNSTWTNRTARAIKDIVNSSNKMLRCTVETCEDFEDGRLPTLDTNIWMERGRVFNTFYEKGMSAKTVIHKDSALSENRKMARLSQNVVRHIRNTNFRVKVVEKSGTTLKSILVKSDPRAGGKCGRRRCLPCEAGVES